MDLKSGFASQLLQLKSSHKNVVFSDGACSGNPGPGGWGAIVVLKAGLPSAQVKELAASDPETTNNRMEMLGAIHGIEFVIKALSSDKAPPNLNVTVVTDSNYLIKGAEQWVQGWHRRGWQTADGKPVKNQDLWEKVMALKKLVRVEWLHVPGHSGIAGNERCDQLAVAMAKDLSIDLYHGSEAKYGIDPFHFEASDNFPIYLVKEGSRVLSFSAWTACERYVKGKAHLKFKKVKNRSEVEQCFQNWQLDSRTPIESLN